MTYTKKQFERVMSAMLAVLMIAALLPVGAFGIEIEATSSGYGTVSTYTGGNVINNGTANVQVVVEETTLEWVEGNELRAEGWWVGIDVVAPDGFSDDATYKVKNGPTVDYGAAKRFADMKDGENDIQLWFPVSAESLEKFASESRNLTLTYAFDWNADDEYEQVIEFSVVPSEKIVLMKQGEQVYPVVANYGTVKSYNNGVINNNGTANVEVLVEETTLQWVAANELRAEGWWVGIDVVAPEGFSDDATYKVKTGPTVDYGAAKRFADMKDGENDIQLWFPVSAESLEKFASESRNLTLTYAFDWNADGEYEQTIVFSVVPGEKIVLMKGDEQVYPVLEYTVTVNKNQGGTVSLNSTDSESLTVEKGSDVNIDISAEEGYQIAKVIIDGQEIPVDDKTYSGVIANITEDTAVSVVFVKLYTVTVIGGNNGTVSTTPAGEGGSVTVIEKDSVIVTATPDKGYRVIGVKINGVELTVSGENDKGFTIDITAEDESAVDGAYLVEITFAPNIYKVQSQDSNNGSVEIENPSVEYGGSTVVTVVPDSGYTVDTFNVEGATVSELVKDENGIHFTVSDIVSDLTVVVKFKSKKQAASSDVQMDTEDVALRKTETLFVINDGNEVTFKTDKDGMRMYGEFDLIAGNEDTKVISIPGDTTITSIELYYKADGELYADWHKVDLEAIIVAYDIDAPTVEFEPENENPDKIYNSDVILNVDVKDVGNYSGIAQVEYWITKNDNDTDYVIFLLNGFKTGDEEYSTKITVPASEYNSMDTKVTVRVTDVAGNMEEYEFGVKINTAAPVVKLSLSGSKNENALDGYYESDRVLTITITDKSFYERKASKGLKVNGSAISSDLLEWTHSDDNTIHTATYTFSKEGTYNWSYSYTNWGGVCIIDDENVEYNFTIDKTAPDDLSITYEPSTLGVVIESLTFGFYKAPVKVTISATDNVAGIQKFIYYTNQGEESTAEGIEIPGDAMETNGKTSSASFEIPAQFRGKVSFKAMDKSGQVSELMADNRVIVVDNIAPGIDVTYNETSPVNGNYYKTDRVFNIKITESNFFPQDLTTCVPGTDEEHLLITVGKKDASGKYVITKVQPEFTKDGDIYTAAVEFAEDGEYSFDIKYTDRSGNVWDNYETEQFIIDKTKPIVEVELLNDNAVNFNHYASDIKVRVTVTERNFVSSGVLASVLTNNAADQYYTDYFRDEKNWKHNGDVHTIEIDFTTDALYNFDIECTDLAGNVSENYKASEFIVDKANPVGLKITYEPTFVGVVLEGLTFGFYKAPVNVIIEATDVTSGIDYFSYSYDVQDGASNVNEGGSGEIHEADFIFNENGTAIASFAIAPQFRGNVSFVAFDKAGNREDILDENCVVVDEVAPGITVTYDVVDAVDGKYFSTDRVATIEITEQNFFARDLYDIVPGTEEEYLVITVEKTLQDGTYTLTKVKPEFTKNGDVYTATIKFDENAEYTFDIKYTDRSGNVYDSYEKDEFVIDKTNPVLNMTDINNKYYNKDLTVTFTVKSYRFSATKVKFEAIAKDASGNEIDLSSKGYLAYLQNQDNWRSIGNNMWETTVVFDIEGNYSIEMNYQSRSNLTSEKIMSANFCVDKTLPTDLKVSYEPTFTGVILEGLTFGFYQAPVKVIIEATDAISGIDHFSYSYNVQEDTGDINKGGSGEIQEKDFIFNENGTAKASFIIEPQFRGHISFDAFDKAGNMKDETDENCIVVDNIAPGINIVYDNKDSKYKKYFKNNRTATITINEANFFQNDLDDGLLVITVGKVLNDGVETVTNVKPIFTKNGDVYTATIEFNEDADYTFDIKYTDRSGNVYDDYDEDEFTVDKILPVINVSYDNNSAKNGNQFKENRKATITITEHNFIAKDVTVSVKANGKEVESYTTYLKTDANWTHKGDVHTAVIEFTDEAHYTFDVTCSDRAGNTNNDIVDYGTSVAPEAFTIDKSAPTDLDITIDEVSVLGTNSITFDKFYKKAITVKFSANCDISGLDNLKYQKVSSVSDYNVNGTWVMYDAENGIVVNPSEKFVIYFRAEDRAGNVSIVNSTGIIVDDKAPVGETNAPEIDIKPVASNKYGLYSGDVTVNLNVIDPKYVGDITSTNGFYSGLNKITYRIFTTDTDALEEGTLLDLNSSTSGAEFDADNLIKAWNGKINISANEFNSNNVIVEITAVDNAGNVRTTRTNAGDIKIDITAPKIEITYDNNDGDTSFDESIYFGEDRIATIVVTERNFDPALFEAVIKNTDGYIPVIGKWTTVNAGGNGDNTTHTAQIIFDRDGDYTLSISCVDEALNQNTDVDSNTGLAPWAFTIDKTAPVVNVTYDNNNALNDNYYKAQRIATITVIEHNFETSRINISLKATDNGIESAIPVVSNWTSDGDVHTATIVYSADSLYVFDFDYTDKAGNQIADFEEQSFYVDKTNPVLSIEKIVDESANNNEGNIGFVITATDTNFDIFTPVLTAVVKKGNEFETKQLEIGKVTDIDNGKVFTVTNIEEDGIYRITCTVVDKAGNAYSQVTLEKADGSKYVEKRSEKDTLVTFSINREGSAFEIDDSTDSLINQYYVQNVKDDIVIVEVNADELKEHTVILNGKTLVQGTDYTVNEDGGSGNWKKYTYTVNKDLFGDEGEYKIVVSSKDKADNNAFSDVKNASVEFVVDRTAPVVTVSGIANNGRYQTESQLVTLIPTDDGGALKTLVVNMVDEDGVVINKVLRLTGKELTEELEKNGGKITFTLSEGLYQNVQIICADYAADGVDEVANVYNTTIENISVSSNVFMIFWANKPLRWGTIGGICAALIALVIVLIKKKKHKAA